MSVLVRSPAHRLVNGVEWALHALNLVANGARLAGTPIWRWPVVVGEMVAVSTAIHTLAQSVREKSIG